MQKAKLLLLKSSPICFCLWQRCEQTEHGESGVEYLSKRSDVHNEERNERPSFVTNANIKKKFMLIGI